MQFKINKDEFVLLDEFYELCNKVNDLKEVSYDSLTYTYLFTPTGIGSVVKVRCNELDLVKDITDYKSW